MKRTELGEEGLVLEVSVVLSEVLLSRGGELEGNLRAMGRKSERRSMLAD